MSALNILFFLTIFSACCSARFHYDVLFKNSDPASYAMYSGPTDHFHSHYSAISYCFTIMANAENCFPFVYKAGDIVVYVEFENGNVNFSSQGVPKVTIPLPENIGNEWTDFCYVYSAEDKKAEVFVNGKLTKSVKAPKGRVLKAVEPHIIALSRPMTSRYTKKALTAESVEGKMSGLRIFDFALTAEEIEGIFNCSSKLEGNILEWSNATWELYNGASFTKGNSPCNGNFFAKIYRIGFIHGFAVGVQHAMHWLADFFSQY